MTVIEKGRALAGDLVERSDWKVLTLCSRRGSAPVWDAGGEHPRLQLDGEKHLGLQPPPLPPLRIPSATFAFPPPPFSASSLKPA